MYYGPSHARAEASMSDDRVPVDAAIVLADLAEWWRRYGSTNQRIAGSEWDQQAGTGGHNPYWEIARELPLEDLPSAFNYGRPELSLFVVDGRPPRIIVSREALCGTFSWSIPSPGDMEWMRRLLDGRGVVEVGAGSGYWAWQMKQARIDAIAYEPQRIADNQYAHCEWTTVLRGDHDMVRHHPGRALFLSWPSYGEPWAAQALSCYPGSLVIYAGESMGGGCADNEFFKLLDAKWDAVDASPAHIAYWGRRCHLTAYTRKGITRV